MIILIMGLPGSGKTTFASKLRAKLKFKWLNADFVRSVSNNHDFSYLGRIRQVNLMKTLSCGNNVIIDMICPLEEMRKILNPDIIVFIDTISAGRYDDTNKLFERPAKCNFTITEYSQEERIINEILHICNTMGE